ncbi:hypothetical protein [Alkalitalea saponilacus]|uniref:Uncharacterized protein n=1 Tax=Alkalitalea saponilacus TaxID=889453 RepID=A0A1T5H4T7_9BACT|nr:hypothetical protein [Alkalitalea saponilacus]ASB50884.1 hypothetical protein CDL62_17880 [Alkalitalea saponilacus]SKC15684.1 hypothetical protein SAMN03080601_02088 [Alkalitalea saponilacus]
MQTNKTKREYKPPYLAVVEIDNVVSMQMGSASEDGPPIGPGPGPGQSSSFDSADHYDSKESIQKNSFDDNPFRR